MELLRTTRLQLRRWSDDDADAFLSIYGRDDVMRWLGAHPRRPVQDIDEARERIRSWRRREEGLPGPLGLWAVVEYDVSPAPVGTALLLPLHDSAGLTEEIEIGWHLHPDQQHRGLATEAARALLERAAAAGIERVLALTDPDNVASQAVARRLGMRDDGLTDRWFGLTARQFSIAGSRLAPS